jgi:hypothetical protein
MLRAGCIGISVWAGFNGLLGASIFAAIAFFGQNAPALTILFQPHEVAGIEARALATINALAVLFNACAAAFCALVLYVTWTELRRGSRAALAGVAATMSTVQIAGFASDAFLGSVNLALNVLSTLILCAALALADFGQRAARAA